VTRAVDLSGNETREQREFTVQPRCPSDLQIGFGVGGAFLETPPANQEAELILLSSGDPIQDQLPITVEAIRLRDNAWAGALSGGSSFVGIPDDAVFCLDPFTCSAPMGPLGAAPGDHFRFLARGADLRALGVWEFGPFP